MQHLPPPVVAPPRSCARACIAAQQVESRNGDAFSTIIVDSGPERARVICDGLTDLPGTDYTVVQPGHRLARRIAALNPDLVRIDAAFINRSNGAMIKAGMAAYAVDRLTPARIS